MAALHRGVLKSRRRQQLVRSNQYAPRPYKQQRKHMQSYGDSLKSSIWPNKLEDQVEYRFYDDTLAINRVESITLEKASAPSEINADCVRFYRV